jgi:hypothetical protein
MYAHMNKLIFKNKKEQQEKDHKELLILAQTCPKELGSHFYPYSRKKS